MSAVWDKMADDGSVLIVIRPHLRGGAVSDYVLRTRLAVREAGWTECETLIWHKPDGGACIGNGRRPRRVYEETLWFSKTGNPFVNPKACGRDAESVSFTGSPRPGAARTPTGQPARTRKSGRTKVADVISAAEDVIRVPVRHFERGVGHPAMFPDGLAATLIQTLCPAGGTVLDCFAGSGSTLTSAKRLGREFYGVEIEPGFCELARGRLARVDNADASVGEFDPSPVSVGRSVDPADEPFPATTGGPIPIRKRAVGA